ncbi:unnamed protein product, partial [Owenia fusiformis]
LLPGSNLISKSSSFSELWTKCYSRIIIGSEPRFEVDIGGRIKMSDSKTCKIVDNKSAKSKVWQYFGFYEVEGKVDTAKFTSKKWLAAGWEIPFKTLEKIEFIQLIVVSLVPI